MQQQNVVNVEFYQQEAAREASEAPDSYEGLPIYALKGLHAHVMDMVRTHVPLGSSVLELGAGTGAMSQRMVDHMYDVTAVDVTAKNFRPKSIPFKAIDLNTQFAERFDSGFHCIVALEIAEHLENVRNMFRQAKRLLTDDGQMIFTTPNTESARSICCQLRNGRPKWFDEVNYKDIGHITPLTSWQLRAMADEAGLTVKTLSSFGEDDDATWKTRLLVRFLRKLSHPSLQQGEILVMRVVNR